MGPLVQLKNMSLLLGRSPAQERRLQRDMMDIQDPASPRYHAWIAPSEFGARYGASPADVQRASAWLLAQGFDVIGASPSMSRLSFNGTSGQVESAFQTELHRYALAGKEHFAPSLVPMIPASLGGVVTGLHGMNDFRQPPPQPRTHSIEGNSLGPSDFATIYDVSPLYAMNITGKGQSIAIVGESYYNPDDIVAFRMAFGLDTTNVPMDVLVPDTGDSGVFDEGDLSESELDMEWSGGIAKDAQVYFVYTGDSPTSYGFFDAMAYAVEQRTAPVVSVSYGTCEKGLTPSDALYYGKIGDLAAMTGVTITVASGDTGAAGCDGETETAGTQGLFVGFPASIPTVTAVGGTEFAYGSSPQSLYWSGASAALSYIPEGGWNDTFNPHAQGLGASGGGLSIMFPRPYWQATALPSASFRGLPDVALSASAYVAPYVIYESWTNADGSGGTPAALGPVPIGGTSASTPSFAGILALLNQAIGAPVPGLGNLGPQLYAVNASVPSAFHDITLGNNMVPCESGTEDCPAGTTEYGYSAGVGYDLVTGLGSVDVAKLVTAWTALAPTSTTLGVAGSGGTEPSVLQLTATVGSNATSKSMAGTVTFYFNTFSATNTPDLSYVLAEAPVVPDVTGGGTEEATVSVMAPAPVGLTGAAQIVAFYGGDDNYLASYSSASKVTTTSTLTVAPTSITLHPHEQTTFAAMGGVPPVTWSTVSDGSCDFQGQACAESKSLTPTTAGFQAGSQAGTVTFEAVDADFAVAIVTITVAGAPVDGGMLIPVDAGVDAGHDAGHPVGVPDAGGGDTGLPGEDAGGEDAGDDASNEKDATTGGHDAGKEVDASVLETPDAAKGDAGGASGSSSGCTVASRGEAPDLGLVLGLMVGFVPLVRTRRREQKRA